MTRPEPYQRCYWFGHRWRLTVTHAIRDGLVWCTYLCRRCPARIDRVDSAGFPEGGGIFTRWDLILLGLVITALVYLAAWARGPW